MSRGPYESLLLIDAGNTRVKWGRVLLGHTPEGALPECVAAGAIPTGAHFPWCDVADEQSGAGRFAAAITGSNPDEVARIAEEWPKSWASLLIINERRRFPLEIAVDFPERVGMDRLLNAVAANVVRAANRPAVIIDSGTATTVDYVDNAGRFCGGSILPGFDLCARALHQYTALLPLIEINQVLDQETPPAELGRNTHAAIASGLYWGHVGAVKELLQRLLGSEGGSVLLTGGAAPLLKPHLPASVRYEPHLALQGMALVAMELLGHG